MQWTGISALRSVHRRFVDSPFQCLVAIVVQLALLTAISIADEPRCFSEGRHGRGELKYVSSVPVLLLDGSPAELAEQQSKLVVSAGKPLAEYPQKLLAGSQWKAAWPLIQAVASVQMQNAPEAHRREVQALAADSGVDVGVLNVANTMLELRRVGGCSALIVERQRSAAGTMLMGRNFDFPPLGLLDKYGLVTIYRQPGKFAFASIGFPGVCGVFSGMNEKGLCIATLDVYSSKDSSTPFNPLAPPVMFTLRRILEESATIGEAEQLLRSVRRSTWMNLAVCDPNQGVVFELTPHTVAVRRSEDGLLPCTNHFRTEQLATSTECQRYERLNEGRRFERLELEQLQTLLDAANQAEQTIQTMIFEPHQLKLHVAMGGGPTSARKLTELKLASLFATSRD